MAMDRSETYEEVVADRKRWRDALMSFGGGGEHVNNPERLVEEERGRMHRMMGAFVERNQMRDQRDALLTAARAVRDDHDVQHAVGRSSEAQYKLRVLHDAIIKATPGFAAC